MHLPSNSQQSSSTSKLQDLELRQKYEALLEEGNKHPDQIARNLYELRKLILLCGLPEEDDKISSNSETECTLRGRVWKVLLRVTDIDANRYISLVQKGSAEEAVYNKIRNDTFRTFKTNDDYKQKVPEHKLIRLLNAFAHSCGTAGKASKISYVQVG